MTLILGGDLHDSDDVDTNCNMTDNDPQFWSEWGSPDCDDDHDSGSKKDVSDRSLVAMALSTGPVHEARQRLVTILTHAFWNESQCFRNKFNYQMKLPSLPGMRPWRHWSSRASS